MSEVSRASPPSRSETEEDDWEKDDVEDSTMQVPPPSAQKPSGAQSPISTSAAPSGLERPAIPREESSISSEGSPAGPRIRLMQRPKGAPPTRVETVKSPARSGDLWNDEDWDSNRAGDTSNRKIWEDANVSGTAAMPVVPANVPALPSSAALRILRRPSPSQGFSPASSGASTPAGSKTSASSQSGYKGPKTLSEREEEYRRARERIFGLEDEGVVVTGEQGDQEGSTTAASSPNSLNKSLPAPELPSLPRGTSSATSSVASSTSSSVGAPRRQLTQAPPVPNVSRSTSANSNARNGRGGKRNGRESAFEPLRPPHEQMHYQQLQLQQQQQLYIQQQQYQMQMQLSGYAQSGYVGPGPMYGMNMSMMGMQHGTAYNPYAQNPYQPLPSQGAATGPSATFAPRQTNPPMMAPVVVRQPAGPDDGTLGFSDLRIRDQRYPAGPGPQFGDRSTGPRPNPMNQYSNSGQNAPYSTPAQNASTAVVSTGSAMGSPYAQTQTPGSPFAARTAQQDGSAWPPLMNANGTNGTPQATARKGPQSVWRP